jgi:hypothetical protein
MPMLSGLHVLSSRATQARPRFTNTTGSGTDPDPGVSPCSQGRGRSLPVWPEGLFPWPEASGARQSGREITADWSRVHGHPALVADAFQEPLGRHPLGISSIATATELLRSNRDSG